MTDCLAGVELYGLASRRVISGIVDRRRVERIRSDVEGLDEVLRGGFIPGSCVVISGGPGSGKSTLCSQFLFNGYKNHGEGGIYVTCTESPEEVKNNFRDHGWDVDSAIKNGKMKVIDMRPVVATESGLITRNEAVFQGEKMPFSVVAKATLDEIKRAHAKRVVIDSLTTVEMQYKDQFEVRQGLLGLIQGLSSEDCVSLLIVESIGPHRGIPVEWALSHGAIQLNYSNENSEVVRSIQVVKMRRTAHDQTVYGMEITNEGIVVHTDVRV
ncbi:MAG: recombinase RecA [Nitrososphaerota archaeon]|nr:recombinase RecA [Nitrososphaerota archaeon]MDG6903321.1 recombinase RecA [Nitrososphaerota archaeon]MDG6911817.1 recombinase RecA [Nitrososphaerota archaeon]MDG6979702.1 recombinase RecA [Nitrososphaerota archaeon]MDG7029826.1 recombinase RecA [Nitrososphaerota archaeon]